MACQKKFKFDSQDSIRSGIAYFMAKYDLGWDQVTGVICGDIVESLSRHGVIYNANRPGHAIFEPGSVAAAEEIAAECAAHGVEIRRDQLFGEKCFFFLFAEKVRFIAEPFPPIAPPADWKVPFPEHHVIKSNTHMGEMTPFYFKGVQYRLNNHSINPITKKDERGCHICRESDNEIISIPMSGHYFVSAFVRDDRCYCFAKNNNGGVKINMIVSDDLVNWSEPKTILDNSDSGIQVFNTSVAYDGKRFVMLYECNDPAYPIFTFKYLESTDLVNWKHVPNAMYATDKYAGGPSLYYMPDGYFYTTYVDQFVHPVLHRLNYRTLIARSRDLVDWEDAPDGRDVLTPDYSHRPDPVNFPEEFEFNVSDAEFIEIGDKVRVYFNGGNQLGIVADNQYAEYTGTMQELFASFFV